MRAVHGGSIPQGASPEKGQAGVISTSTRAPSIVTVTPYLSGDYRVVDGDGDEAFAVEVTENLLREAGVPLDAVEGPWHVELRVSESAAKKVAEEALRSGMLAGAARMRAGNLGN